MRCVIRVNSFAHAFVTSVTNKLFLFLLAMTGKEKKRVGPFGVPNRFERVRVERARSAVAVYEKT